MISLKAFKYRIYPTKAQQVLLSKTFGCVRVVWNHNVEVFNKYDKSLTEQTSALTSTQLRQQFEWMKEVSASALQQKETDFKVFKKSYFSKSRGKKVGRPSFKHRNSRQSYRLPNQKFALGTNSIRLEKIGRVKLMQDRPVPTACKFVSVTISKDSCGQFFASVLVETEIVQKPKTGRKVGLDIGLKTFLTGSDGFKIENPRFFRENQTKLKQAQHHLARKVKGSTRSKKAILKVARIYNTISNQRNTFIQKITTQIIDRYDFIAIEDLNVASMAKNSKLAKSLYDAAFAKFYATLKYKAEWYGKEVTKVDRWFPSSKLCSCCGWRNKQLTLADRIFRCQSCGMSKDRDLNASENILQQALGVNNAIRTQSECQTGEA